MYSNKINRVKVKPVSMDEMPSSYLYPHTQLKEDRGNYKLRGRNDSIQNDLNDLARRQGTKISTSKVGNSLYLVAQNTGISVVLVN